MEITTPTESSDVVFVRSIPNPCYAKNIRHLVFDFYSKLSNRLFFRQNPNINAVTRELSGRIGYPTIFRRRRGSTVVSKMPQQEAMVSEKRAEYGDSFQRAVFYGKAVLEPVSLYKEEAKKGGNPFNAKNTRRHNGVLDFYSEPSNHSFS